MRKEVRAGSLIKKTQVIFLADSGDLLMSLQKNLLSEFDELQMRAQKVDVRASGKLLAGLR